MYLNYHIRKHNRSIITLEVKKSILRIWHKVTKNKSKRFCSIRKKTFQKGNKTYLEWSIMLFKRAII